MYYSVIHINEKHMKPRYTYCYLKLLKKKKATVRYIALSASRKRP